MVICGLLIVGFDNMNDPRVILSMNFSDLKVTAKMFDLWPQSLCI